MIQTQSKREMELAQEHIEELKREFRKKRTFNVIGAGVLFVASLIFFYPIKLPMIAFCFLMASLICLLFYFDANGQLHVIGLRSTKTLYPRLSILKRQTPDKPGSEAGVGH